jgi:hypothetical protein
MAAKMIVRAPSSIDCNKKYVRKLPKISKILLKYFKF